MHAPAPRTRPLLALSAALVVAWLAAACGPAEGGAGAQAVSETTAISVAETTTTTAAPTTTTTAPPDPARRVLLLGDSSMVDASPALQAMLKASGVTKISGAAAGGFGLTQLGTSGQGSPYPTQWPQLIASERPDLSIVMLGNWDTRFYRDHGPAAYTAIVDDATRILLSGGGKVLWLSVPPGGTESVRDTEPAFEAVAAMHPGQVFFVEIEGAERGPNGDYPISYVAPDGSTVHLRKADGWHFCPDGAERLAAEVNRLGVVHGVLDPAVDGWQHGSWRRSELYAEATCHT